MLGLGAVSGTALAGAVLHYDGSVPINVLTVIGVLVVLPLVFLLLSGVLPFVSTTSLAGEVNVGGIIIAFLKRRHPAAEAFFSDHQTNESRDKLLRWRMLLCSQQFGLTFALAALAVLVLRVSFSDLAFGWSTTLDIEANRLSGWINTIAAPWARWSAAAIPSLELIEQSRYYRLETAEREISAALLATWWIFIALCLAVYGVVLRALALVVATLGWRRAVAGYLLGHSEIAALIDRLDTPEMSSGATSDEVLGDVVNRAAPTLGASTRADLIILWNGATGPMSDANAQSIIEAGGEHSIDADLHALETLSAPPRGVVQVITKAWEPPLLELHDYLNALRERVGRGVSIVVHPVGANGEAPSEHDVDVWRRSLVRLQDSEVYVA